MREVRVADYGGWGLVLGLVVRFFGEMVRSGFPLNGLLLQEVASSQLNRSHIWGGGPTLLYVSDCLIQTPTTIPHKVGNGHSRGAASTGCAVEVHRLPARD